MGWLTGKAKGNRVHVWVASWLAFRVSTLTCRVAKSRDPQIICQPHDPVESSSVFAQVQRRLAFAHDEHPHGWFSWLFSLKARLSPLEAP